MGTAVTSSKRVAKNTLFLYMRMFIVMGVTIFTSRVILGALGEIDYGVLNVVGGIAFSFGFFSSSMTNATQRYLAYGHGEGNIQKVTDFFNLITILYIIASGIILLIGGALGFWIVSRLNIPHDAYWPAIVVYYTTLLALIITLFASVFDSVLVARENLKFYAYISVLEALLKLGIAYLVFVTPNDKLQIYALLFLAVTTIIKGSLIIYCLRKFPECKFRLKWEPHKLKGILAFMGWNGLGTLTFVINEQGINILLNIFFGPIVNAARGVASQVNMAISNFTNNFFLALNPQIIKSYASGDIPGTTKFTANASIFSFYLLWTICLPIILRRDYILAIWLKEVPEYTSSFLLWILIYSLVNVLTRPQWTLIQAIGKLKHYIINGTIIMIGAIPIGYLLYKLKFPPVSIFIVMVALRSIYLIITLITMKNLITFSPMNYITKVLIPIGITTGISYCIMHFINYYINCNFGGLVIITLISILVTCSTVIITLNKSSRTYILNIIKSKIHK